MEEQKIMPCPACPEDCPRHCETCKVFCRIYKDWQKEHPTPQPKVTVNDEYAQQKHKEAERRRRHGKG